MQAGLYFGVHIWSIVYRPSLTTVFLMLSMVREIGVSRTAGMSLVVGLLTLFSAMSSSLSPRPRAMAISAATSASGLKGL